MESRPRGRGLVITMTGNRNGCGADVKKIHQLFLYLDIKPVYVFDPKGEVNVKNDTMRIYLLLINLI